MRISDEGGAMTRTQILLALAAAFVLGSVAAPVASRLLAPAYAQPATSAKRWQQFCTFRRTVNSDVTELFAPMNQDLKEKGDAGWELVGTVDNGGNILTYCFKRPSS
jgi:hypothetical protein